MSDEEEMVDMGNLELYEGDLSLVVRSDGELEFFIAIEDNGSDDYARVMRLVRYLMFVLENKKCVELFESESYNATVLN